jgi:hypothetical protein
MLIVYVVGAHAIQRPADEAHDVGVREHLGKRVEVIEAPCRQA